MPEVINDFPDDLLEEIFCVFRREMEQVVEDEFEYNTVCPSPIYLPTASSNQLRICNTESGRLFHKATSILFSETKLGLTATGVQFVVGNKTHTAKARREVILSAGTDQTPQLLELSGKCFQIGSC